jgi:transcriptional regulator with XRE-family HTH domain
MSVCGVPESALAAWGEAWDRASHGALHHRSVSVRPAPEPSRTPALRSRAREDVTVLGVVLGSQLCMLREAAGLTREQAARVLRVAPATIRRMEHAEVALKIPYVQVLLSAYGLPDRDIEELLSLCEHANARDLWQRYRDPVPAFFRPFLILEGRADGIHGYEPHFVPGLLQTADYARAVMRAGRPAPDSESVERRVQLRVQRQRRLVEEAPPHLWMVLDEAVLHRPVGSDAVMRAQLDWLLEAGSLPHIHLQVVPFGAGPHDGAYGPFLLFRFDRPRLPDIAYTENLVGATYLDSRHDTARYREAMDCLSAQASTARHSRRVLEQARDRF